MRQTVYAAATPSAAAAVRHCRRFESHIRTGAATAVSFEHSAAASAASDRIMLDAVAATTAPRTPVVINTSCTPAHHATASRLAGNATNNSPAAIDCGRDSPTIEASLKTSAALTPCSTTM